MQALSPILGLCWMSRVCPPRPALAKDKQVCVSKSCDHLDNEARWNMREEEKEHVVTYVAKSCAEINVFWSKAMTGLDYNWMNPMQEPRDDRVEALQQQCQELGMDCSGFILSHIDLGWTHQYRRQEGPDCRHRLRDGDGRVRSPGMGANQVCRL